jgi:hypothetical protein
MVEPPGGLDAREWCRGLVAAQPTSDGGRIADRLHQVCLAAGAGLGMSGAVVILRSGEDTDTVAAASDPASAGAAELEHTLGEGPSRDAFTRGRPVLVDDLGEPGRFTWVAFGHAAVEHGIGSVFAFPLHMGAARFGVLTMFGLGPQHLDRTRTSRCLALAQLTTEALLRSSDTSAHGRLDPDLESALDFRNEIYQAQGMAMVTLGTDLATALARMRAHAYQSRRTLLEVSLDILAGRLTLTDERPD